MKSSSNLVPQIEGHLQTDRMALLQHLWSHKTFHRKTIRPNSLVIWIPPDSPPDLFSHARLDPGEKWMLLSRGLARSAPATQKYSASKGAEGFGKDKLLAPKIIHHWNMTCPSLQEQTTTQSTNLIVLNIPVIGFQLYCTPMIAEKYLCCPLATAKVSRTTRWTRNQAGDARRGVFLDLGSSRGCCWFWSFLARSRDSTWKCPYGNVDWAKFIFWWFLSPFRGSLTWYHHDTFHIPKEIGILDGNLLVLDRQTFSMRSLNHADSQRQCLSWIRSLQVWLMMRCFLQKLFWAAWNAYTSTSSRPNLFHCLFKFVMVLTWRLMTIMQHPWVSQNNLTSWTSLKLFRAFLKKMIWAYLGHLSKCRILASLRGSGCTIFLSRRYISFLSVFLDDVNVYVGWTISTHCIKKSNMSCATHCVCARFIAHFMLAETIFMAYLCIRVCIHIYIFTQHT